ncbi:octaprenyl diphosphate synthase [Thorsellia anophelis]|uniref:Octaprenyl diphosphate synthase n=1 Tax=Thorsellia anophelis DSM 18579 TaxID=1123402 RepID=A0A1H9YWU1_9GAMM|nr:octaprenyl diphosphate synthase [Thorsellia anophelis]SES73664.1 octaprenyl-diphosphate synthase [Thorsellia anophelis DSM 18579]
MNLSDVMNLTEKDMKAVNEEILSQLNSKVSLINQVGYYLISSGGKRLRPLITLLSAHALGYKGQDHIKIAALIEFIHTATLLHDDVVDESPTRRGKSTANAEFGNAASVLVGDFIYTRSFQMMTDIGSMPLLKLMSDAVNVIAEGEVLQLINCNNPDVSMTDYMQVIYSKTARLFEAATHSAAVITNQDDTLTECLKDYGKYLGTAFQLIDDHLDYTADSEQLGKALGDDLAEGKVTLPLLHAMAHADGEDRHLLRQIVETGDGRQHIDNVLKIMNKYGSLDYTKQKAEEESDKAIASLSQLDDSIYKDALIFLANLAVNRTY